MHLIFQPNVTLLDLGMSSDFEESEEAYPGLDLAMCQYLDQNSSVLIPFGVE